MRMESIIKKGDLDNSSQRILELAINTLLQKELTAFLDYIICQIKRDSCSVFT